MRILISAYACEPGKGSEPEVGLRAVLTAASRHQVWVITRENNVPPLRAFLAGHPLESNIELVGLEVPGPALRLKKLGGLVMLNLYYHLWQRRLRELAVRLDAEIDFDLVHHVTFATYWSHAGVAAVSKPFVWGPLGGGVRPPLKLVPAMGPRGAVTDIVRVYARPLIARMTGVRRTAQRAAVIIAQNPETSHAIGHEAKTLILPNALFAAQSLPEADSHLTSPSIVSVGRLIGLKGLALALAAMTHLDDQTLEIFGDGPDRRRLERLAQQLGVDDRVRFRGQVPRDDVLDAVAKAQAFLHPSLHDEAPLAMVEALALGTPVVCLDRGGPPVLIAHWPLVPSRAVTPSSPEITARDIATALDDVAGQRVKADSSPSSRIVREILAVYETLGGDESASECPRQGNLDDH